MRRYVASEPIAGAAALLGLLLPYRWVALRLSHSAGQVAADAVLLTAGDWREPAVGERLALPAPCLFHGGHTDPDRKRVMLRAATDPYAAILYGPKLPFAPGRYAAELRFDSSAAPGTDLGRLYVEGQDERDWVVVAAGQGSARLEWDQRTNLPLNLVFVYLRNADMEIQCLTLQRVERVE